MRLWPIHPKPHADELLSSWVTRIAMANRIGTSDFCKLSLPGERVTLKEIDRTHHPEMMQALATGTGVPIERVQETSLLSDEGYVFLYRQYGTTEWVLPTVNVDGHVSKGLAYCPQCLKTDADPYYRKSWRYAFNPVCPVHQVFLRQGCPECGKPHYYFGVTEHSSGSSPIKTCMNCGTDISDIEGGSDHPELIEATLQIQERINQGIAKDSFDVAGYGPVPALPYLRVLHALMRTLGTPTMASWVIRHYRESLPQGIDAGLLERTYYGLLLEQRSMEEISTMLCLAMALMTEWPRRLMHFVGKNEIPVHHLFSYRSIPFWVTETTSEHCFVEGSAFSKAEIENARQLLRAKLGRRETLGELKSFMTDGVAKHLVKVSREKRQDVELSPKHFKLEAPGQNVRRRLGRQQEQARKLINTSVEDLVKISILRQHPTNISEMGIPVQSDLFQNERASMDIQSAHKISE